MTISDLDAVHHEATIEGDEIVVGGLRFSGPDFFMSGMRLVRYDGAEFEELIRLGVLSRFECDQVVLRHLEAEATSTVGLLICGRPPYSP